MPWEGSSRASPISISPAAGALTRYATTAATGVTAVAGALVLIPVFVFLMLRGYHRFVGGFTALIPPRWRPRFEQRTGEVDQVLSGFIRGQLTVAFILVILYSTAFSIIGIPLAILVGILAGFGELIPYIGNAIALTLGSLLALAGGQPHGRGLGDRGLHGDPGPAIHGDLPRTSWASGSASAR